MNIQSEHSNFPALPPPNKTLPVSGVFQPEKKETKFASSARPRSPFIPSTNPLNRRFSTRSRTLCSPRRSRLFVSLRSIVVVLAAAASAADCVCGVVLVGRTEQPAKRSSPLINTILCCFS